MPSCMCLVELLRPFGKAWDSTSFEDTEHEETEGTELYTRHLIDHRCPLRCHLFKAQSSAAQRIWQNQRLSIAADSLPSHVPTPAPK